MNAATIAQIGTPRELHETPSDAFVADFIGEANLMEAAITALDGERAKVRIGALELRLPHRGLNVGPVRVAVRPGRIRVLAAGAPDTLPARIEKSTYVGNHMEYRIASEAGRLFATSADVDRVFADGEAVGIGFAASGPVLLPAS